MKFITRLSLGVLLCILGCIAAVATADDGAQLPMRRLRITIDVNRREELFTQLRGFAEKHKFEFILSDYGTGGELYLVEILGDDIKILATITRADPEVVSIGFFARSPDELSPDKGLVDDLLNDLKIFINEIPNVTITEEK